jgi:hypothetical protein
MAAKARLESQSGIDYASDGLAGVTRSLAHAAVFYRSAVAIATTLIWRCAARRIERSFFLEGLAPVEPQKLAGIMPNAQHQTFHGFMTGAPYELAIVEFDDQGRCYDKGQMDAMAARLDMLAPEDASSGQDVNLVAFVHGWKRDARSDDDNLSAFRVLLKETVEYEQATSAAAGKPRPVLGVFVG